MSVYRIEPERSTLHGSFSRDYPAVLTIASGDTVIFRTLDAAWNLAPRQSADPEDRSRKFEPRTPDRDSGHALCGPVAVEGAQPGMTLEIQIGTIRTGTWGWTSAGGWPHDVHERLGTADREVFHQWTLDAEAGIGRNQFGHEIALRPFMGVMGMPPAEPGIHPTPPPRSTGGNLDCKELITGTSLFLPIAVPGGLFSVGDGHAAQGDGEVCVTAVECPMEHVELTFHLHPNLSLKSPRARIPGAWLTLGLHENLQEATNLALEDMLRLMNELHGLDRHDALALASVVVDFRITQIVNGVRGVHAILRDEALKMPEAVRS